MQAEAEEGVRATKYPMPEQDPKERIKNFEEVALGYDEETAVKEAKRCLQCKRPGCVQGCPVGVDIPAFIRAIQERDFDRGIEVIREKNSLPAVCGRVCPHETQCESLCWLSVGCSRYMRPEARRKLEEHLKRHGVVRVKREPVAIGRLERFLADYELRKRAGAVGTLRTTGGQGGGRGKRRGAPSGVEVAELLCERGKEQRVAVVGSGPAGLSCAYELVRLGYDVVIFEALHEAGGVLTYGIPEFRLPKHVVKAEIERLKELGVKIVTNVVVGRTITVEELLRGFGAVFIGTGAGLPRFMGVPGENLNGIYSANEFLTRINLMKAYRFPEYDTPIRVGRRVAVVGGGNVALDCARCALRLGAEESIIVYRRTEREMPARAEEIKRAREEGVRFEFLATPVRYIGENGWVRRMECVRMRLGEPDASGRRRPIPIEGSEFLIDVDTVVVAIGQRPNAPSVRGLAVTKRGTIVVDEEGKTSVRGVFAGGDVTTGAATVISAMSAGKRAALAIHKYLRDQRWLADKA
ncbi:MAG: NADPH-dependent glutamate synthase beta chain or related oxidoreductase [Candidatus Alkanophagales archaeon MCA70_species_1]|nr:NADPH-dependent glutamate synthase beta chain or related oxidoreductase [Candidatus Alkanophaga volatiphilum]